MEPAHASPEHTPSNLNIANVLTVARILGVPLFGWLLLTDGGQDVSTRVWAWVAFALLMITDRIDGDLGFMTTEAALQKLQEERDRRTIRQAIKSDFAGFASGDDSEAANEH